MLAYVFWHWPQEKFEQAGYEADLLEFHRVLASAPPRGFLRSVVFRTSPAPWIGARDGGYEEWYLVEGSWVLDPLNQGAVSEPCKSPHDTVARQAAGGTAGLYRLRRGEHQVLEKVSRACWLGKPEGMSYDQFYQRLRSATERPGVTLWGRQMVLGPTPEFCVHSSDAALSLDLPVEFKLSLELFWPDPV